jgi:hypothetical protein
MLPPCQLWEIKLLAIVVGMAIIIACFKINNRILKDFPKHNDDYDDDEMDSVDDDIFS